jgi:hypothetical protein
VQPDDLALAFDVDGHHQDRRQRDDAPTLTLALGHKSLRWTLCCDLVAKRDLFGRGGVLSHFILMARRQPRTAGLRLLLARDSCVEIINHCLQFNYGRHHVFEACSSDACL